MRSVDQTLQMLWKLAAKWRHLVEVCVCDESENIKLEHNRMSRFARHKIWYKAFDVLHLFKVLEFGEYSILFWIVHATARLQTMEDSFQVSSTIFQAFFNAFPNLL